MLGNKFKEYSKECYGEALELLRALCAIPAPSGNELKRAEFCRDWLTENGIKGAYIDDAYNCICPINAEGKDSLTVFVAHTDTVFPDTEPMPIVEDEEKIVCPGVGDDTASLTLMLLAIRFIVKNGIEIPRGALFVANSCEEGLGNLKGTRKIFEDYKGRIAEFVSFDGKIGTIADECVGSHRYEVSVKTPGGHSYLRFGNRSAIDVIAEMISEIYAIVPPEIDGKRTTYNVGTLCGGTSVNTIAESASMLCEYRSSSAAALAVMKDKFTEIFEKERKDAKITVSIVGERPCEEGVDADALSALRDKCAGAMREVINREITFSSSSTDCNIPLSLGVPAICASIYSGGGAHTRTEWVDKSSLSTGLEIALRTIFNVCC